MKQMTTWQRLNAGTAGIILLLLVGLGLAFWMEKENSFASQRRGDLAEFSQRIKADFAQMSLAVFTLSFDPKNGTETNRYASSRNDFLTACDAVVVDFSSSHNFRDAVNHLRDFYEKRPLNPQPLESFYDTVVAMAATSTNNASRYYLANARLFQSRCDELLKNLDSRIGDVIQADMNREQRTALVGLISIALILISCAIVGRFQSRTVSKPLKLLVESLERMRGGDFTKRLEMNRADEFGVIGEGLDRLADDLSMLVGRVQRSGIQVNMTSTEIAATAKQQQSTANEIAATTAQIGATSKEISATSKELVRTMNEVSDVAEETAQLANTGQSGIGRMENTMRRIIEASSVITAKLAVMNEKTGNINSVVTTITKVADQTNLLSLNAAIEAEKAGEYGLGFAVVAMEIRRLADQTAVSTYDIEKMVKEMQSAAAAGVMGMDKFSEEVRRGVEEIRQVSAQLEAIIHQVQTLTPRFQTVNEGMHTQSTGASQISETLGQLSEAAQQTAESLRQSNLAIEQLNEAARGLQTSIAKFKLEG